MKKPVRNPQQESKYRAIVELKREMRQKGGAQRILLLIGSGAVDHVMPADELDMEPTPGLASQSGVKYTAADGGEIPNLGEHHLLLRFGESNVKATFQVADVTRPILSVGRLVEAGHTVRFYPGGGVITNKGGREIHFKQRRGVYVLEGWVRGAVGSTFGRQATQQ